jgi:hypothetical protein
MKFDLEGLFITLSDRSLISKELLPFARIGIKNFKVAMEMESDDSFKLDTSLDSLSVTDIRKTCEWMRESEDDEPLRVSYFPDCVEGAVVAQVSKDAEGHMMVEATLETLTVVLVMDFLISFEHFFGIPIQKTLDNNKALLASISTSSLLFRKRLFFNFLSSKNRGKPAKEYQEERLIEHPYRAHHLSENSPEENQGHDYS